MRAVGRAGPSAWEFLGKVASRVNRSSAMPLWGAQDLKAQFDVHTQLSPWSFNLGCAGLIITTMPTFDSKQFRSTNQANLTWQEKLGHYYRQQVVKRPFLLFGVPFIGLVVGSSFLLTPATALRYERHDRLHRELSKSEAMELGLKGGTDGEGSLMYNPRRRLVTKGGTSERDEYYRLMAKDLDNWEQKRVERWKDEPDGRLR